MQISEHYTLADLTKSNTATRLGIKAQLTPSPQIVTSLKSLAAHVIEPLRAIYGGTMIVTSVYRCEKLNRLIGGSSTSQHVKGEAMDFEVRGLTITEVMKAVVAHKIPFDQLIHEYNSWVHISFDTNGKQRGQILKATKVRKKSVYTAMKL